MNSKHAEQRKKSELVVKLERGQKDAGLQTPIKLHLSSPDICTGIVDVDKLKFVLTM